MIRVPVRHNVGSVNKRQSVRSEINSEFADAIRDKPRVGVIVPSGNAAAEVEIGCLVRPQMNVYVARFPHMPGRSLPERLHAYNDALPAVVDGFGRLSLDAVVVACSGSHYLLGPDGDRAMCEKLSATGRPVAASTLATLDTCADLGISEVTLVSPYEPWLTEWSCGYWEQAGLRVRKVVPVRAGGRFSPYDVSYDDLVGQVAEAGLRGDEALLFTGTGMFTFTALAAIGTGNDRVLLTSNVCAARWARQRAGVPAGQTAHRLLTRLAGTRSHRAGVR